MPQVPSSLETVFLGFLWSVIKEIKASFMCDVQHRIALHTVQDIGPHLAARGKSHGFSRVAAGTWGIFSTYNGDGPSSHVFVQ